jgi:hypothetical protein
MVRESKGNPARENRNKMTAAEIIPHSTDHTAADYITVGKLHADTVCVRFNREAKGRYRVEISILDRDYTHADDVAEALKSAGMLSARVHRGGDISVVAPIGFRAPSGFARVDSLR